MGKINSRDKEIWKPVVGYEGHYEVSNLGRVKSVERRARFVSKNGKECTRRVRERILHGTEHYTQHRITVMLSIGSEKKRVNVHRLVAMAFIPNPNGYSEINHIDENPRNNRADNLEWCTRDYNMHYGTIQERIKATRKKRSVERRNGSDVKRYEAVRYVDKDGFCTRGVYYSAESGRPYKGYYWRFI